MFVLVFAAVLYASCSRLSYLYTSSAPPPVPDNTISLRSMDRPEAFRGCGHWQESYMDFHERTLAGALPPRYLVSVTVEAGLADRLIGTISQFYLALLSQRAFQITNAGQTLPPLEWAYDAPFINWTRADDPPILTDRLKFTYKGQRGFVGDRQYPANDDVDTSKYWGMYLVNSDDANSFYEVSDLKGIPEGHEDAEIVFITSNRGRVFRLFDNPHHKKVLWYVASDSALLRAHLLHEYGKDTVVTRLGGVVHTDCSHATPGAQCQEEDLATAVRSAAGTIWAMAMTDYQIVTVSSRFGRVAAWLTMGWHNLYEISSNARHIMVAIAVINVLVALAVFSCATAELCASVGGDSGCCGVNCTSFTAGLLGDLSLGSVCTCGLCEADYNAAMYEHLQNLKSMAEDAEEYAVKFLRANDFDAFDINMDGVLTPDDVPDPRFRF
ncbi:hypothetical protein JKP88DRAFT_249398 [Tribonema minus]|uniref:Uncharacterized protein n=1 Tax=Tribonema minus TaxID=303371 RepID=A0A835YJF6_9STRA|nr:hypothetical protein JKP88DRAFT_249398 [Tribonema minus]